MNLEKAGIFLRRVHVVRWMLALIAFNILIYFFQVLPNRSQIVTLHAQYTALRAKVQAGRQEIENLEKRLGKLQQARKDLEFMYTTVLAPRKTGLTDIRLELESLLRGLQVKTDFTYSNQSLEEYKLHLLKLSVPVEGNYREVRRFINDIERSRYFLILDRVDLSSGASTDNLKMNFSLSTFLVEGEK